MPHRCTKCGKEYPDGDMRILKGCECGNNKFLYVPKAKAEVAKVAEGVAKAADAEEEPVKRIERQLTDMGIASVKIIAPGKYELNLDRLFTSDEIVIALQEDGKYIIHLPSLLKSKKEKKGKRVKKR
ncbi:MAG: Zn-ribbon domain-containing protein [Archaeoglobus sp.]|nr:Zn-ribbon domain-containing protein [Archaeoglobus sp.]